MHWFGNFIVGAKAVILKGIEDFLQAHPKIQDVAVIGVPSTRLGEITAAVIQVKRGMELTQEDVTDFCRELPRYKQPRKIIFNDVPRNPTGKIEKPKLRKEYGGTAASFKVE